MSTLGQLKRFRWRRNVTHAVSIAALAGLLISGCGATEKPRQPPFPGPRAVHGPLVVGLADGAAGYGGAATAPRLDQIIATTRAKWLRDPLEWSTIEPSPGHFTFSYYDHYVLLAARRGLHILAQLVGAPRWAAPTPESVPADPAVYARYVAAVVGRYGPGGSFWREHPALAGSAISTFEVWNEPYFASGNGGVYDPGRYARLVRAAAVAGHSVAPSTRFEIEAEMASHLNRVWTWWVDALYQAVPGLNRYIAGVAVHDFGLNTTDLSAIVPGQPYPNYDHLRRIEDLRRQFLAHGAGGKPFWITETGWSTCRDASGCVTPARQAANLATLFDYVRGRWRTWVQGVFVYRYQDGAQPASVQGAYGLVRLDGRPKSALRVFRTFAAARERG